MDETPQPDSPSIDPTDTFPDESANKAAQAQRKAILSTAAVTIALVGIVWLDPLGLLDVDVEINENQAAESLGLRGWCTVDPSPGVTLAWSPTSLDEPHVLERREISARDFENIFTQSSEQRMYTFFDTGVLSGSTYEYRVRTSHTEVSNTITVKVSPSTCK